MAPRIFSILAIVTLSSSGFQGIEGGPEKGGDRPERGSGRPGQQEMMKRLDSDKNGDISFAEFSASERIQALEEGVRKKLFDRLDKDGNGTISKKELKPPHEGKGPRGGLPFFDKLEANKDQQVSFEEFSQNPRFKEMPTERVRRFFDRMDRNKDGFLSRKDHVKPGPGPRGKKGGRPEGGLKTLDTDGDGKVSEEEFKKGPGGKGVPEGLRKQMFKKLDQNQDGFLDASELREPRRGPKK